MTARSVAKDFYKLQKNIASFSNGEARILSFDDELTKFEVELNIKDGLYKDGIFVFEVTLEEYPDAAPTVWFDSPIFHPNIGDGDGFDDHREICFSLLNEHWDGNDLEDVVHGVLFLVKNPNQDDAMNQYISSDEEDFATLVRQSLEGGEVGGVVFDRNSGLVQKDKLVEQSEIPNSKTTPEIGQYSKTEEKRVGRNSREKFSQPTFRIGILDIQRIILKQNGFAPRKVKLPVAP